MLNGTLNAFLPLYGREVLGLTVTQLGWLVRRSDADDTRGAAGDWLLSHRLGRRWVIITGLVVCSAAVLLASVATNVSEIVTAVLAYAAGVATTTTAATSAYITDMTRRARYGAAHGVFGTIYDVGDALGPSSRESGCRRRVHSNVPSHGGRCVHDGGRVCRRVEDRCHRWCPRRT